MKTGFYILVLVLFTLSCNNDDNTQQSTNTTLEGPWSLVNVSGGLLGVNDDFEKGLIVWDFSTNTLELEVTNNNTVNVTYDGLPSGTYDYQILTSTGEDSYLVINEFNFSYKITGTAPQLTIDEGIAVDGFLLTFSR